MKKLISMVKERINKKSFLLFIKLFFIIVFCCIAINLIDMGLSKYESNSTTRAEASVAFFLIDEGSTEGTISLGEIVPSKDKYVYQFTVSNFKDDKVSDVSLDYSIQFITTTNLPLVYKIYKNENYTDTNPTNIASNIENIQNGDGVYYKQVSVENAGTFTHGSRKTDVYNLVIEFDENYKNSPDDYSGKIEMVRVLVDAKQIVE